MRGHWGPCERLGLETISGELRANKRLQKLITNKARDPPLPKWTQCPVPVLVEVVGSYRLGTQGTV